MANYANQDTVTVPKWVHDLAEAIAHAEGFYIPGSRPARTRNPGDLGNTKTGTHAFMTETAGWNALFRQVEMMFNNTSKFYRSNMTFSQIAAIYATDSKDWLENVIFSLQHVSEIFITPENTLNAFRALYPPEENTITTTFTG